MKYYYLDEPKKQIRVSDTILEPTNLQYLGASDRANIRSQAAMFVRGGVGYSILSHQTDPA